MKILILGSGGREHALPWKLADEGHEMFVAPGNPGTASVGKNVQLDILNPQAVLDYVVAAGIEFTVPGPEGPLEKGIVDLFNRHPSKPPIFGPTKHAARLTEISKADCCGLLEAADVPIPNTVVLANYEAMAKAVVGMALPLVIKYDGLAAGKGVRVVRTKQELHAALEFFHLFKDAPYVVQECVEGVEASCFYYTDGTDFLFGGSAADYKPLYMGGPNTGGMGGYAPHPAIDPRARRVIEDLIVGPTIKKLADIGFPYRGVMYFQLMLTRNGPVVIEINCRFGDPEAELLMPLLDCDLLPLLIATTKDGALKHMTVKFKPEVSVGIVLASEGYPGAVRDNQLITMDPYYSLGGDRDRHVTVFQAGTKINEQHELRTKGGRVLVVVGRMPTYREAKALALRGAEEISFDGKYFRRDIADEVIQD